MPRLVRSCLRRFARGLGWLLVLEYSTSRQLARKCRRALGRLRRKPRPDPEYVI